MRVDVLRPWHLAWIEPRQAFLKPWLVEPASVEVLCLHGQAWAAVEGGLIHAAGGVFARSYGAPVAWFATHVAASLRVMVEARRFCREQLDRLLAEEWPRIEADIYPDHEQGRRFAASLGFERECLRRAAATDGRDLELWSRVRGGGR
jgi:hypothetical protein